MHILHHSNLGKWTAKDFQVLPGPATIMTFSEFLKILHKYIGIDVDNQDYLSFLLPQLMHEPQSDAELEQEEAGEYYPYSGARNDLSMSSKIYGGSKSLPRDKANKIRNAYNYRACGLLDEISDIDEEAKERLIAELTTYGFTTTKDEAPLYCCKMIECFLDNLSCGVTTIDSQAVDIADSITPNIYDDTDLKMKYGAQLLAEVNNMCPNDKCDTPLFVISGNLSEQAYEIVQIRSNFARDNIENLISLCPECSKKYRLNRTEEDIERLADIKVKFSSYNETRYAISRDKLVKGVENVIKKIADIPEENLMNLNYNPAAIKDKMDGTDTQLFFTISTTNAGYFDDIHELFKGAEEEGLIDFDRFCHQIRYKYEDIAESGVTQRQTFDLLTDWLMGLTNEEKTTCEAVISYFVQKCEVFDDLSK